MNKNVETFIGCDSEYSEAKIALFGAPFDSTTSFRPGARFGSSAIRHESFGIETYSPYQDKDLTDLKVFDCGDLELCFGSPEDALKDIEEQARKIVHCYWSVCCDGTAVLCPSPDSGNDYRFLLFFNPEVYYRLREDVRSSGKAQGL